MRSPADAQPRPDVRTFEDAANLDPDTRPGELAGGVWLPMTRNTWKHGELVARLAFRLQRWVESNRGWSLSVGDPGTKLARHPDVLRGPDLGVVRKERVPTGSSAEGWLEGGPDLAVEVVGDSQTSSELLEKAVEYLTAGSRLVWIVDGTAQRVVVVTPPDRFRIVGREEELDAGDVLPGFRCEVTEIFA